MILMILYGKQVLTFIIDKHRELIKKIYLSKEIDPKFFKKLSSLDVEILRVDNKKAQAMAQGGNHQGFIFEIDDVKLCDVADLKEKRRVLVLVGLSDMGNIGAIARSAYCLGYDGIIISEINDIKLEMIIRRSSGAAIDIPLVHYKRCSDLINELKIAKFECVASSISGDDIKLFDSFGDKVALFLGSEGEGISNKILKRMDKKVKIEMAREFDSLNVSVAAGILMDRIR